jgi:hypothetical protein
MGGRFLKVRVITSPGGDDLPAINPESVNGRGHKIYDTIFIA